jgi:hypothetical protein
MMEELERRVYAALYLVACELEQELGTRSESLAAWRDLEEALYTVHELYYV